MLNSGHIRRVSIALIASTFSLLTAPLAAAETFPSRLIEVIVPAAPGGGNDVVARHLARFIEGRVNQSVVVRNEADSQQLRGARIVATAKPDGHTILVTASSPPGFKAIFKEPPVDPLRDFEFVSLILRSPNILAVNAKYPDVASLVAASKSMPNGLVYASYAVGFELTGAVLADSLGLKSRTAHFSSAQDAARAVAAGDADYMLASLATLRPWGEAIRPAMITQTDASGQFPGIPSDGDVGKGLSIDIPDVLIWVGVMAPAGTPADVVAFLNAEVRAFTEDPAMQAELAKFGWEGTATTPEEFRAFFAVEEELMIKGAEIAGFAKR